VIIDAIKESRRIFQRMNSYAIYRIAETLRVLFFMTLSILVFNFYPVTAVMIVMIALLNDGAICRLLMTTSYIETNRNRGICGCVVDFHVLGVIGVVSAFFLVLSGRTRLPHGPLDRPDTDVPQTSVAGHLTIFLTRTRGPFCRYAQRRFS